MQPLKDPKNDRQVSKVTPPPQLPLDSDLLW